MDRLRVLLIEDSPADILLVRRATQTAPTPAELIVAKNGDEARRMIADEQPDLVILDLFFPKHCGLEILAEYRADAGPAVIVLTGSDSPMHRERARKLGARAYLVKSMQLSQFEQAIHTALQESAFHPV
jgi:DNA-binding NarL/FixJ family response regulator